MIRAYKVRNFQLTDNERLPSVSICHSDNPYFFADGTNTQPYQDLKRHLDSSLLHSFTAAFIVIRNDSILYERYFNGFSRQSLLPSFSVAKSFVATLVSIALKEGKIKSLQEPVTTYIPELYKRDKRFSKITLQHLLDMRSGILFREGSYGLKDDAIRLGFSPNLLKRALKLSIEKEPGGDFNYQSINTELLALVVERATGRKISTYLQEKIWQPLGAEYNASWNVDGKRNKQEIAFAGLNATARDFAKLGVLYLRKGLWQGNQILDSAWVCSMNNADSMNKAEGYKNQWWSLLSYKHFKDSLSAVAFRNQALYTTEIERTGSYRVGYRTDAFSAEGILNQCIYINPKNNVVIVRLGHFWQHPSMHADQFIYELGEGL